MIEERSIVDEDTQQFDPFEGEREGNPEVDPAPETPETPEAEPEEENGESEGDENDGEEAAGS